MSDLLIKNSNVLGYTNLVDIAVQDGYIIKIGSGLDIQSKKVIDAGGRFVSPGLVDAHAHLDKSLIYDRNLDLTNKNITLNDMIISTRDIKEEMTAEDVKDRALELIKRCVANGITTIRTNVEADPLVKLRAVEGIIKTKEEAKNLVDLQTIAFAQEGWFDTPDSIELGSENYLIEALKMGIDGIAGNINKTVWPSSPERQLDRMFEIAKEFDCDIDMHLDNADNAEAFTLPYLVEKTAENKYQGRVTAGHVVGIAHVDEKTRTQTIKAVRDAAITITVLPSRMKLTCVRELLEGGVNVAIGTDNYRDKFIYFGNHSLLERMLLLGRLIDIQRDDELMDIYNMGTYNAAKALRLENYGLDVGKKADIAIFDTDSLYRTIMELPICAYVIKNGRIVAKDGKIVI